MLVTPSMTLPSIVGRSFTDPELVTAAMRETSMAGPPVIPVIVLDEISGVKLNVPSSPTRVPRAVTAMALVPPVNLLPWIVGEYVAELEPNRISELPASSKPVVFVVNVLLLIVGDASW